MPDAIDLYLRWHSVEGHTPQTIETYRKRLGVFLAFLHARDGPLLLDELTAVDILAFLEHLKPCSAYTIRSRLATIKAFLSWAEDWELIGRSPAHKLRPPKVPRVRKPFLPRQSFESLLSLCPANTFLGARRTAMLWVFATTGIRLGELCALELADLDWDKGLIKIRMGKGQIERWVPFHNRAQLAVLPYLKHRSDDWPHLWVTEERTPLAYGAISTDMKRLFDRAGLSVPDRCHIFRRTWAADAVRGGIPRQYTQAVAGWTTPRMLDHYTAAMAEEEGAIEAFRDFDPFGPPD